MPLFFVQTVWTHTWSRNELERLQQVRPTATVTNVNPNPLADTLDPPEHDPRLCGFVADHVTAASVSDATTTLADAVRDNTLDPGQLRDTRARRITTAIEEPAS